MAVRGYTVWLKGDWRDSGEIRVWCDYSELAEKICRVDEGDSLLPKEMRFDWSKEMSRMIADVKSRRTGEVPLGTDGHEIPLEVKGVAYDGERHPVVPELAHIPGRWRVCRGRPVP
jgi:hypothetical protein